MAKKNLNLDIFGKSGTPTGQAKASTATPAPASADDIPATGRTIATGVGLKESELAMIDAIVAKSGGDIARNAIMRYAIRFFLKAYVKGQVDPLKDVDTPKPKSKLRMP